MYILSFGAVGFMFIKYLCDRLCTNILHFLIFCFICFWYVSVGSLFNCVIWFSCMLPENDRMIETCRGVLSVLI